MVATHQDEKGKHFLPSIDSTQSMSLCRPFLPFLLRVFVYVLKWLGKFMFPIHLVGRTFN